MRNHFRLLVPGVCAVPVLVMSAWLSAQVPTPDTRLAQLFGNGWMRARLIGDVDNDGIQDMYTHGYFAIHPVTGTNTPGNYIVSGRSGRVLATLDSLPTFQTSYVLPVPDENGDGHPDFYVGATDPNVAVLVSGATGGAIRTLPLPPGLGGNPTSWHGSVSMARIPSVNGDAVPDLVIGDGSYGFYQSGAIAVISGVDGSVVRRLENPAGVDFTTFYFHFGKDLAVLDDIDGDGFVEVVATQSGYYTDYGGGTAHVLSTNPGISNMTIGVVSRTLTWGFGWHVIAPGDLDGDGYRDFVVTAPAADDPSGPLRTGGVFAFSGGPGVLGNALWSTYGTAGSLLGMDLAELGEDVDQDGVDDVAVVAPLAGELHVLSGATGVTLRTWALGLTANEEWTVEAFDWNGDGRNDIMVSLGNGSGGAISATRRRPALVLSLDSYNDVGLPCPGGGPILSSTPIHPGQPVSIGMGLALPQQFAVLAFGAVPYLGQTPGCGNCTVEVYPGCYLRVQAVGMQTFANGIVDANGSFVLQFVAPNDPQLVGVRLALQGGTSGGGPLGFTLSNGFYVLID